MLFELKRDSQDLKGGGSMSRRPAGFEKAGNTLTQHKMLSLNASYLNTEFAGSIFSPNTLILPCFNVQPIDCNLQEREGELWCDKLGACLGSLHRRFIAFAHHLGTLGAQPLFWQQF